MKLEKDLIIKRNNDFYLDKENYQVLTMLYKPLITASSINIYLSLYETSLYKTNITSIFISDIISQNLKSETIELKLDILKEYKLIKYNSFEIELYPPLLKDEFNNIGLLNFLKNYCSKDQYNLIVGSNYPYDIEIIKVDDFKTSSLKYKTIKKPVLPFEYNEFINHIDNKEILNSYKSIIEGIQKTYNYSLNDMLRLTYELEIDSNFDINDLIKKAFQYYEKKNKLDNKVDKKEVDYLTFFKTNSAEKILSLRKYKKSVKEGNQLILDKLREEKSLNESLISLLITYSLVTNNDSLHPSIFYDTIIKDWKEKGITTVEEAYNYINDLYKKYSKQNKSYTRKEDWFNDMWAKIKEEEYGGK